MKSKQPKAPFLYFGGKSNISTFIWQLLGDDIKRYFEPFAGSLAVMLARKRDKSQVYHDIANDLDCLIINVWRALKYAPKELAKMCVDPVSHVLLWQRVCYIAQNKDTLLKNLLQDDNYYDVKLAAYWLYVKATEIGVIEIDKIDTKKIYNSIDNGLSVGRPQLIALNGIHSSCKMSGGYLCKSYMDVKGLAKKNGHIHKEKIERLKSWFIELQSVLENAKLMCGDWKRLFNDGTNWQDCNGSKNIGIFFDPPYSCKTLDLHVRFYIKDILSFNTKRRFSLYRLDSYSVAKEVNDFCVKHANKSTYRIVIAGFEGEHNNLESYGYSKYAWSNGGGYGNLAKKYENANKERLWASKSCFNIDLNGKMINEYLRTKA